MNCTAASRMPRPGKPPDWGIHLLYPTDFRELQRSEELYGILAFVWVFVAVGIWNAREEAQHAS
jgi:hypothetical protein